MHQSVHDIWIDFNRPLEGIVKTPYADKKGLITIGMGNMFDVAGSDGMPIEADYAWHLIGAQWSALAFRLKDGTQAPKSQVKAAWYALRNDPNAAQRGWEYAASIPEVAAISLGMADISAMTYSKLAIHDTSFHAQFPDWEERPADAQLAVHSMAWGLGSGFWHKYPKFTALFKAGDYYREVGHDADGNPIVEGAASECAMNPKIGTIVERNRRNVQLFKNASLVAGSKTSDPSVLVWS